MALGKKHQVAEKEFLKCHPEFEPVEVYKAMCRLLKLGENAVQQGIGKLFSEGKLKTKEKRPKTSKRRAHRGAPDLDFR